MSKYVIVSEDHLQHHGILGQKWGIRRYQPYPTDWDGIKGKFLGKIGKALTGGSNGQNSGGLQKMSRSTLGIGGNIEYTLSKMNKSTISSYVDTFDRMTRSYSSMLSTPINNSKMDYAKKEISKIKYGDYLSDMAKYNNAMNDVKRLTEKVTSNKNFLNKGRGKRLGLQNDPYRLSDYSSLKSRAKSAVKQANDLQKKLRGYNTSYLKNTMMDFNSGNSYIDSLLDILDKMY